MMHITKYLFEHYYSHYKGNRLDIIPTPEQIEQAIANHPEKIIVVGGKKIKGVGIFLTLTDKTFSFLHNIEIQKIDVLQALCLENGKNFHFVLLAADSYKTIMIGLRMALKLKPKTISWWNPNFTKLHTYKVN